LWRDVEKEVEAMSMKSFGAAVAAMLIAGTASAASLTTFAFTGDNKFNALCTDGVSNTACEDAVGEFRRGNNSTTVGVERELGINDNTGAPQASGQFEWTSGTAYAFSFAYLEATDLLSLTVDGTSISTNLFDLDDARSIFIRTRNNDTNFVTLSDLTLNTHPFSSVFDSGSADVQYLQVGGIDFSQDWTLAGTISLNIGANSSNSLPAAQFKITDVAPIPLPAAAWMLLSAMGGLGALGWRKRRAAA
jgi:hypothetical protein